MLADHFSKLSLTLEPISMKNFHPKFRKTIKEGIQDKDKPVLNEYEVYRKLKQAKKPNSSVPGDIPKPILKEFTPEFAFPVTKIFNKITKSACYPRDWVREYQTPIPKIPSPQTEDDIRNIAKTNFLSKQYERFIADWILPIVEPFLDPGQCGGLKGSSITHYTSG